jgi:RNA polymerase sigma factor (sigma-70 family)
MSPLPLRRYRAERMLRKEFEGQRERVLGVVRGRLRSRGVVFDDDDLEGCYAQAWQGLYTALMEGQEIENPTGWLVEVCYRRAIDESRAPARRAQLAGADEGDPTEPGVAVESDLAGALDDRLRLRQIFEGLRARMSPREQQAASLCYLQGLSRAQAAARMGVSEARMRKLMEGGGPERPGVAAKMSELVRAIGGGDWCEQQGSLMRALAFGILDPAGERYQLAQMHRRECPACRAYVVSLRGLAAVLPPLPLSWASGTVGLGGGAAAGGGAGSGAGAGAGVGGGTGAGAGAGAGVGAGTGSGGGLFAGGSLAAKLAAGCLVVAGVGGGCVAVIGTTRARPHPNDVHALGEGAVRGGVSRDISLAGGSLIGRALHPASRSAVTRVFLRRRPAQHGPPTVSAATAALRAQRELGFERAPAPRGSAAPATPSARLPSSSSSTGRSATSRGPTSAAHEFGIE